MSVDYGLDDLSTTQELIDAALRAEATIQAQKTGDDLYMTDQDEENGTVSETDLLDLGTNSAPEISDVFDEKQPKPETEAVLIRVQIPTFRTMKPARGRRHRPHSTTSRSERNANRQKLEKMIDQNLLAAKKSPFWSPNSEAPTADPNTWKWVRGASNWPCNAKDRNSFFSPNTVLDDELVTKIANSGMPTKERAKNWPLNFSLKEYISRGLKKTEQAAKIYNKTTEYWHYLVKKGVQLHEQEKEDARLTKVKNKNSKFQNVGNSLFYGDICPEQDTRFREERVFFIKKTLKAFILDYIKSNAYQQANTQFFNSSPSTFEASAINLTTPEKNLDRLTKFLLQTTSLNTSLRRSEFIRFQSREGFPRRMTLSNIQNFEVDLEDKIQKLKDMILDLKEKLKIKAEKVVRIANSRNDFLGCAEQLQIVFERASEAVLTFQKDRNGVRLINTFRQAGQSYNAISDELHRLKNFA